MRSEVAYNIIDKDLERCQDWLGDRTGGTGYDIVTAIGLEKDGDLVAVVGYNNFTEKACHVHFAIEKGTYPPRKFIWFVHYYPFIQVGLDVMLGIISTANEKIINLTKRLGYEQRCVLNDAGLLIMALNKQNCKWI